MKRFLYSVCLFFLILSSANAQQSSEILDFVPLPEPEQPADPTDLLDHILPPDQRPPDPPPAPRGPITDQGESEDGGQLLGYEYFVTGPCREGIIVVGTLEDGSQTTCSITSITSLDNTTHRGATGWAEVREPAGFDDVQPDDVFILFRRPDGLVSVEVRRTDRCTNLRTETVFDVADELGGGMTESVPELVPGPIPGDDSGGGSSDPPGGPSGTGDPPTGTGDPPPTGTGDPPITTTSSEDLTTPSLLGLELEAPEWSFDALGSAMVDLGQVFKRKFDINPLLFGSPSFIGRLQFDLPGYGPVYVPILPEHLGGGPLTDAANIVVTAIRWFLGAIFTWMAFVRCAKSFKELA